MDYAVSFKNSENGMCVALSGKMRVEAAASLLQKIKEMAADSHVRLDWSNAEHVDASVLQVLLAWKSFLEHSGGTLRVMHDNAEVREYLRLSGMSAYFPMAEATNAAQEWRDA